MRLEKIIKLSLLTTFLLIVYSFSAVNQTKINILEQELYSQTSDSLKIKILVDLCWEYRNSEPQKSIEYGLMAIEKSMQYNDYENLVKVHSFIGVAYRILGNYSKSTDYYFNGLELSIKHNLLEQQGFAYINIANLHIYQEYYNTALENLTRALSIAEQLKNQTMLSYVYLNFGRAKLQMKDFQGALSDFVKTTEIRKEINLTEGLPVCYKYLGDVYFAVDNVELAFDNYDKALELVDKQQDRDLYANILVKKAELFLKSKSWNNAKINAENSLHIAKEIGAKLTVRDALGVLYKVSIQSDDYRRASEYLIMINQYNDTLFSQQLSEKLFFLEYQYEKQKKESEIDLLNKEKTIKELSLQRANTFNVALLVILFLVIIVFVIVLIALKQRKEQNTKLEQQHAENEKQRESIEKKNKHLEQAYGVIEGYIGKMTDSIRYAKRIQDAVMPSLSITKNYFTDYFCFYKPKDFVSGDFYWFAQKNNVLYFAVADCTGHGVPGAFMSIIGLDLLNQALNQQEVLETNEIVEFLNSELLRKLHFEQEELVLKDSMDIALCSVNLSSSQLKYCGALIPFVLVRDKTLIELKSDYASVGTSKKLFKKPFSQQTIDLLPNDWIYLFSDGFMDQIGGNDGRKFMRSNFNETLIGLSNASGNTQKDELDSIFTSWKGNNEQIDDVLILGLKV